MSEYDQRHGKRETIGMGTLKDCWRRYREWVAGMDRGKRLRYRLFQVVAAVCVVILTAGLALEAWIRLPEVPEFNHDDRPNISDNGDPNDVTPSDAAESGRRDGVYTFLVAGQDSVSGGTDTMLLFTYDTKEKQIYAISLLRDTMINTSASSKRLNAVYARNRGDRSLPEEERVKNGMTALKAEVNKLTGIYPDFYVLVQWEAIGELVDALGGVYFEVPFDMDYDDPTPGQDLHIHQKAGYRLLSGQDAMEVIRFRKSSDKSIRLGDAGRTEIQRDFLSAVLAKCLQPATLLKVPALAQVFLDNVNTDLSISNLLAFAQLAVGMDTEKDVTFYSMPFDNAAYGDASMAVARQDELLELLNSGLNPYLVDIQAGDLQLIYKTKNGYGVTNAELADPKMAGSSAAKPAKTEKPTEADESTVPDETTVPDEPVTSDEPTGADGPETSDEPGGQEGTAPTDEETPPESGGLVDIDPGDIFPGLDQASQQELQSGRIVVTRPETSAPAA